MLSITKDTPVQEPYFWSEFLKDATMGGVALLAIIPLALVLGGFSFFLPWLIVTPPVLFAVGFMRGAGVGNIWLKGISTNAACLLLLACKPDVSTFLIGLLATVLPTVGGISLRRYRVLRAKELH